MFRGQTQVVEVPVLKEVPMGTLHEEVIDRVRGIPHAPRVPVKPAKVSSPREPTVHQEPKPKVKLLKKNVPKKLKPRPKVNPIVVTREQSDDEEELEPSNRARVAGGHKVWGEGSSRLNMDLFKGRFPWRDSSLVAPMDERDVGFQPGLEHRRESRSREGSPERARGRSPGRERSPGRSSSSPRLTGTGGGSSAQAASSSSSAAPRGFESGQAKAAMDYVQAQLEDV